MSNRLYFKNIASPTSLWVKARLIVVTMVTVLSLVGVRSISVFSLGNTYYVDNTNGSCSDAGPGTLAQPFCTIAVGTAAATFGDTVSVLAGTYAETITMVNSGIAGNPITFSAASGVTVTGAAPNNNGFRIKMRSKMLSKNLRHVVIGLKT